ncbi:hypothetical protein SCLCIDRAFT_208638 [Scleroderma citrinum Foug A]|uniref:Uncharacterized protein n=1 Tax=Scleroderma citrinum Foug A TaxID=1036808 RepID=A0A0C3D7H9_9AGAM|nr:hypothetical protein SCLCIDRAFT_208638 [Scleroderma citrinum Foug A]
MMVWIPSRDDGLHCQHCKHRSHHPSVRRSHVSSSLGRSGGPCKIRDLISATDSRPSNGGLRVKSSFENMREARTKVQCIPVRPFQTPKHQPQESSRTLQILVLREKPNWEHVQGTPSLHQAETAHEGGG